jgi:predicted helicase
MVDFYNEQRNLYKKKQVKNNADAKNSLVYDPSKITWTDMLIKDLVNNIPYEFDKKKIGLSLYRPYIKTNFCYEKQYIQRTYQQQSIFPSLDHENIVICLTGKSQFSFSVLISSQIAEMGLLNGMNGATQCFPLYWYEKKTKVQNNLFEDEGDGYIRHDAISDFILEQAKTRYGNKVIKEDIFYYVYGLLHQSDYRKTFANDLKKMLPRLPLVEKPADFWAFSNAGRELAKLHLNYEEQSAPKGVLVNGQPALGGMVYSTEPLCGEGSPLAAAVSNASTGVFSMKKLKVKNPQGCGFFAVNQMKFPAKGQKDTILYNSYLTISNIPLRAYEYVVNGKSAIEWIMERYAVTTHKESGIKNDPNDWAREHDNPQYILNLLLSVITVSLETVDIVAGLPKVEWG